MKRTLPKKRRDRASGMSPYARYGKRPYVYSEAYRTWRNSVARNVARSL